MYRKHLSKCSYQILKEEAEQHFETTDPRVIEGYIGRPDQIERHPGQNIVRLNRQSGQVAQFDYMNERHIKKKDGLAQRIGLITVEGNRYILHHELMSYYTSQSELANSSSEAKENSSP